MKWKLYKTAEGYSSLENFAEEAEAIFAIIARLETYFGTCMKLNRDIGITLEAFACDFWIEESKLTIGWDCWSGVYIMAHSKKGNSVVNEIALLFKNT